MSGGALALALGAAFLHAGWNVALAGARDTVAATGGLLVWGVLLLAPFALLFGDVSGDAAPYIAASAVLELAYFVLFLPMLLVLLLRPQGLFGRHVP